MTVDQVDELVAPTLAQLRRLTSREIGQIAALVLPGVLLGRAQLTSRWLLWILGQALAEREHDGKDKL